MRTVLEADVRTVEDHDEVLKAITKVLDYCYLDELKQWAGRADPEHILWAFDELNTFMRNIGEPHFAPDENGEWAKCE